MGFADDRAKEIKAANAQGDTDQAAKLLANYILESGMSRKEQQGFIGKLGDAVRGKKK